MNTKEFSEVMGELNNISDAELIHCVYEDHERAHAQAGPAKHSAGSHSTLSLTVSGGFSKYASNEAGVFLIETLRRTFYDYSSFDELDLTVRSLTDSAVSSGIAEPGMQADDGKSLVWEEMSEKEIDGVACYAFELRYSEDEDINGKMAGRLLGIYAVSKDSAAFYQYNMSDDAWEKLQAAAAD